MADAPPLSFAAAVVVGLGFGDEGKGTTVDHLVRRHRAAAVVRYGGGPQATHHVVLPDGRWHGFSQLGAGTFVGGVATHLTRDVLVEPVSLLREDQVLREKGVHDALTRLTIDPGATLVLPYHKMIGQLAELARGGERHGSVGLGVGEAARERDAAAPAADRLAPGAAPAADHLAPGAAPAADRLAPATAAALPPIRLADARDPRRLRELLAAHIAARLAAAAALAAQAASAEADERLAYFRRELDVERLARILHGFVSGYAALLRPDEDRLAALRATGRPLILEGAQGVLLDPHAGFPPYVTKTATTPSSALELLAADARPLRLGVLRAYAHRHGPGPLPSEDPALAAHLPEQHNAWNRWQGSFRVGPLDLVLARHAAATAAVDAIALTCLDRLTGTGDVRVVTAYEATTPVAPWFDDAFTWRRLDAARVRIDALLPGATRHAAALAAVLATCRPAAELRLPGWTADVDLTAARSRADLPPGAQQLVELVATLAPVTLISVGPTYREKIVTAW